jgi:hypothetical protein
MRGLYRYAFRLQSSASEVLALVQYLRQRLRPSPEMWVHLEPQIQSYRKSDTFPQVWGAIHQLLGLILKLRILVLLPVSNLPYVVNVNNYF